MENTELNINEIMCLTKKSEIFYQLEKVGEYLDKELEKIKDIEVTEESKQEVKKVRTNINNTLKVFEDRRKTIKNQVMEEYNAFNEKYELEVKEKLERASNDLKIQIDDIESKQIEQKREEITEFAKEYIETYHLERILNPVDAQNYAGVKINLSNSIKSLKDVLKGFIERVANEVKLIELDESPTQLLYEYQQNGYDLTKAKLILVERQKQIEELTKNREEVQEIEKEEEKVEKIVETITAPKEIIEDDEVIECQFKVKGTKEQLKLIRNYLKDLGVSYE